jgi:hypothetical protein
MGTKSRETIYGGSIRASAERAAEARKQADRLACEAWNQRMLGFQGPAQPSPALGDALNAGYRYLEVRPVIRRRRGGRANDEGLSTFICLARELELDRISAARSRIAG